MVPFEFAGLWLDLARDGEVQAWCFATCLGGVDGGVGV